MSELTDQANAMLMAAELANDAHNEELAREAAVEARNRQTAHDMLMQAERSMPSSAELEEKARQDDIRLARHFLTYVQMTPDNAAKFFSRKSYGTGEEIVAAAQAQIANKL